MREGFKKRPKFGTSVRLESLHITGFKKRKYKTNKKKLKLVQYSFKMKTCFLTLSLSLLWQSHD